MYQSRLYGSLVNSDRPLFSGLEFDVKAASAPRYQLELLKFKGDATLCFKRKQRVASPLNFQNLDIETYFYSSHTRELMLYSNREFGPGVFGQPWCFEVKDVVSFYWLGGHSTIYYELGKEGSDALLTFWFTHIFLPAYFTLEDMYDFIHAGAVEIEAKPVLFIAPSTGGKSTLTDYFIKQGHGLISDDKVATYIEDGRFIGVPSHPHHRPYRRFEDLGYRVDNMFSRSKPIHAFYALERNEESSEVIITEIKGFKKFETLLPNYLYSFKYLRAQRLKYLADMVNNIPIYEVKRPWDMDKLVEVHNAIVEHSRQL